MPVGYINFRSSNWGFFLEGRTLLHVDVTFGLHSVTPWGLRLGELVLRCCSGCFALSNKLSVL